MTTFLYATRFLMKNYYLIIINLIDSNSYKLYVILYLYLYYLYIIHTFIFILYLLLLLHWYNGNLKNSKSFA